MLNGKKILLGVSGGIAAYKSPDLVRRLRERGAEVQVVMTAGAQRFVTPHTFQAVSGREVRDELWDQNAEAAMGHIELARWADAIVLAPASADLLARLAAGLADDLLATVCLASDAQLLAAPAMNRVMWSNAATQANCATLRDRGMQFVGPGSGEQACGETGAGRMSEPLEICAALEGFLAGDASPQCLAGRAVLVTAGPTREPIDPVRYLTNHSSGKMGFAVAQAAAEAGASVVLVAGPVNLATPRGVKRVDITTTAQMYEAVHEHVAQADIFIGTAAVSDYRPSVVAGQKMKKTGGELTLVLQQNPDILASVAALAQPPFTVGFAAETNDVETYAVAKLERKKLNMIAANQVSGPGADGACLGFDRDDNALTVLWKGGRKILPTAPKPVLARQLVALIAERYS